MPINKPIPDPLLAEAAIAADARYHAILSDVPDGKTEIERLGLMLREEGGSIAFGAQMNSPFAGQLGGGGNLEDKNLSRWVVRSQREWRGGRGQEAAYGDTTRFHDSVADTRFPGQILLPPKTTQIPVATSNDPQNVPQSSSTTAQTQVYAKWDTSNRAPNSITVKAEWSTKPGVDLENTTYPATIAADPLYYGATVANHRSVLQTFTAPVGGSATISKITVRLARYTQVSPEVWLNLFRRSDGVRIAETVKVTVTFTEAEYSSVARDVEFSFASPVPVTAGTEYIFGLVCFTNVAYQITAKQPSLGGTLYIQESLTAVEKIGYDMYFKINGGSTATDDALSKTRARQKLTTGGSTIVLSTISLYLKRTVWGAGSAVNVYLQNSGGTTVSTGTMTDPGVIDTWKSVSMSAFTLQANTDYYIVLEADASTNSNNVNIIWNGSDGVSPVAATSTSTGGSWSAWSNSLTTKLYYQINSPSAINPYYGPWDYRVEDRAQSFTIGGSTVAVSKARVYLQLVEWVGSPTLTLNIHADNSDAPGGIIGSAVISQADMTSQGLALVPGWLEKAITTSPAPLSANTRYWISMVATAPTITDRVIVDWHYNTTNGQYTGNVDTRGSTNFVSGSWQTLAGDAYFIINNGTGLGSSVTIPPIRFNGGWYIAAGTGIYKFNTGTSQFDLKYTANSSVTSMAVFAGKLFAALGDSTNMVESSDGTNWSASAGPKQWTWLRTYTGYMYGAKLTGGANALSYTADGTTWAAGITVATSAITLSGIIGFQNEIILVATTGIYALSSSYVYQTIDFSNEQYAGNGINAATWMADGKLYVPVGQSLHAYDGSRMTPVGLDLDEGLPVSDQGRVSAIVGSRSFLFVAIDAGTSGRSGIYAWNGTGWHCLVKATSAGRRIRSMGIEQSTSATNRPRLWYWEDGTPWYVEFPDLTDNPNGYASFQYQPTGYVVSSWIGGELSQIPKDFQSVIVRSSGCNSTTNVDIYIEVDRSGVWLPIGTITESPYQEIPFLAPTWGAIKTTSGSTAQVIQCQGGQETIAKMGIGDFVRINAEVGQIAMLGTTSFTLVVPLSEAPAAGTTVYPARPAGREIRYKAVLNTATATSTPIVKRISVKMQELLIDKFRFTMTVRIENGLRLRGTNAQAYPYTADQLRDLLYAWIRRLGPFYLTDPGGKKWKVKIASAAESGFTNQTSESFPSIRSTMTVVLDEV